jgi:hypothetical protein
MKPAQPRLLSAPSGSSRADFATRLPAHVSVSSAPACARGLMPERTPRLGAAAASCRAPPRRLARGCRGYGATRGTCRFEGTREMRARSGREGGNQADISDGKVPIKPTKFAAAASRPWLRSHQALVNLQAQSPPRQAPGDPASALEAFFILLAIFQSSGGTPSGRQFGSRAGGGQGRCRTRCSIACLRS